MPTPRSTVIARPGAITQARALADLSVRDLGAAAGVSHGTVNNVERGRSSISRDKAEAVAGALRLSVHELFVHADGAPLNPS
ncbi:helix-turn-helix domain-containing protein [Isoptericola dokdonensis]|uniref:Helix-turn-helix protein n=1 Tax=Isoptericola dokdonensis DS-3 TaxID=1300344 RepID=A0A161ILQ2_9MICO|nr:helix-turn-helix transcriptional regulator [Isoptericola dokdonensis]ANC31470.1 helix-turn-helix protein [Isoptericola dokdonensis DS-3]